MTAPSRPPGFYVLIPCAGVGSRASGADNRASGAGTPKQYLPVAGKPMVMHTLAAFSGVTRMKRCLVVVSPGDAFLSMILAARPAFVVSDRGGDTRAATVANGLAELRKLGAGEQDWVLVHDAARCLVTTAQIDGLIDACQKDDVGGLLAHKLPDTLKREKGGRCVTTIDRSDKWLAQTPQMFRIGALASALDAAGDRVTDEAGAMEAAGLNPLLVEGGAQNFKITYPEDFALAEAVLRSRA
ncbi:MAG: 2-C-methyl-D-erythritol 4-phosphate cytidylyltransferase [Comamonadaceae bacterium]|nr:MAG: 2-C-methyl-D-erythritol 4-phosphate cytidylyltransferase [Comamonadaceae bacterium]